VLYIFLFVFDAFIQIVLHIHSNVIRDFIKQYLSFASLSLAVQALKTECVFFEYATDFTQKVSLTWILLYICLLDIVIVPSNKIYYVLIKVCLLYSVPHFSGPALFTRVTLVLHFRSCTVVL